MSPDSQAKYQDMYGRAKTVRIGKWRWPPPRDDGAPPVSFLEFKQAQKSHHKRDKLDSSDFQEMEGAGLVFGSAVQTPTIQLLQQQQQPQQQQSNQERVKKSKSLEELKEEDSDIVRAFEGNDKPVPGSIGKLRISSEMKAKLEQLTMDHSVRSTKPKDTRAKVFPMSMEPPALLIDPDEDQQGVKKISESRKHLLEQKLRGSGDYMVDGGSAPRSRGGDRFQDAPYDPDLPPSSEYRTREQQQFVVENLVKSQVQRMERASREIRDLREELGHPLSAVLPSRADYLTTNGQPPKFFPPSSLLEHHSNSSRSLLYEESLAGSGSRNGYREDVTRGQRGHGPPPPVGPPGSRMHHHHHHHHHAPSVAASSGYYAPSTVVPKHREPPAPVSPQRMVHERMSADKIEFEESSEFLKPMDTAPPTVMDTPEQRTLESIKTRHFPPSTAASFGYTKVSWTLRVRKEVFSPSEKLDNPVALHLVFCQVIKDVASSACIRMNREEKRKLQQLIDGYGVTSSTLHSNNIKLTMKRNVVDVAKDFPNYFSRLFPISGGRNLPNVQLLGVSHSGVRLVRRERDAICDYLRVLDTISFEDIAEVSVPRSSTLQILLRNGGWMTLYSHKAEKIRNMVERYCVEAAQGGHEYVRAVADYVTREATLLSFRENDIIRVVKNRNLHLDKGWLYGVLDNGDSGIFPCEYVAPLGKQEAKRGQRRELESSVQSRGGQQPKPRRDPRIEDVAPYHDTEMHGMNGGDRTGEHGTPVWVESKMENFEVGGGEGRGEINQSPQPANDAKSLLQFALFNFRESLDKYEMLRTRDGSIRGSIKLIESLKTKKGKGKKGNKDTTSDWTWKELADMVKYTKSPLLASLLKFEAPELNKLALECFIAIMRYMGDYPMTKNQSEVDCVYTILVTCHKYPQLRDEVYCQLMKQTTNNKSPKPDSCQRGWRLFSIVVAYFECSDALKPYLFKYLETAAYDKRRAYHGTAMVCLQNLRKTFKYGGRKNVPSIEEISAISAGRNSKRQIYRLPGGTERVINTKSTTVVQDIIEEICTILNVRNQLEMEEFSLYCIVEGDPYTMPLNREEYILDVTTELLKNGQVFYLIFCRSVWYYPLRLDNHLYIEVIFNQVAPDYLEGLLLVMPHERVKDQNVADIAKVAALLHRAADMEHTPAKEEVKYLLPKPILGVRDLRPAQWVEYVQQNWPQMTALTTTEAKAQCLDILQKWPLFGSCFFIVKWIRGDALPVDHILALNKEGVHFLEVITHETTWKYPFSEVISTRKVRAEDGTLFLDMKCGNLMVQKITRIQTDQAHEVSRLIRQYINIEQKHRGVSNGDAPHDLTLSRHIDK